MASVAIEQLLQYTQHRAGQLLADNWARDCAIQTLEAEVEELKTNLAEANRQLEIIQQELVSVVAAG